MTVTFPVPSLSIMVATKSSLPFDAVARLGRRRTAVPDQIESNHTVILREIRRDRVPPIERCAEAMNHHDWGTATLVFDIGLHHVGIDQPSAVAGCGGARFSVNEDSVGHERDRDPHNNRGED